MDKTNRNFPHSPASGLRRCAILLLIPLLVLGALLSGCRVTGLAATRVDATPDLQAYATTVPVPAGCGEGLLVASAWECFRTGLRAPKAGAQP